jgi:hypothetical protein
MKRFLVLYMASPEDVQQAMANSSPAEMKEVMDEWKWGTDHDGMIVDMGAPLGKTKRITAAGVADTKNEITGYSIVEAESLDSVPQMFVAHPHFKIAKGVSIEVIECMEIPAM